MFDNPGTITIWLNQLKEGERAGVQCLWEAYFQKLVHLARQKLRGLPQDRADSEQIALDAFNSFCLRAEQHRFPKLEDRDDLWQILVMLTHNKSANLWEHHTREKRDFRLVMNAGDLAADELSAVGSAFYDIIKSGEPDARYAAEVAEQCDLLLQALPDDQLREIAILKMEGYTNREVAEKIDRSKWTVELRLKRIRMIWSGLVQQEDPR